MIIKQRDGKLERLIEKQKILKIVNERKKDLENEIEALENDLEENELKDNFTGYPRRNREVVGADFRNDYIGADFRNTEIGQDYRTGQKFYSASSTSKDSDPIIY